MLTWGTSSAPPVARPPPGAGVGREPFEGVGAGVGIAWLHEESAQVSLYDTLVAVDVAGDDRQPGGHGVEQHDPERLLPGRWRTEDVRRLVEARLVCVRNASGEEDVVEPVRTHETP